MSDKPLNNKIAVVTGAGRGIGKAIAVAYARAGASVGCAARTQSELEETVQTITAAGGQALAVQTDVTDLLSVARLFEAVARRFDAPRLADTARGGQGIDILVINAGANYDRQTVEKSDPADWQRTLEVNLTGAYYCAQAAIPYLKKRGAGKIITIGSGMGHHGMAGGAAYACSKAGLWMLTRILAQELWADRISVNELIPGPVITTIDDAHTPPSPGNLGFESEWIKMPEDVAALALFLAAQPDVGPTAQSFSLMRRDG
jgi:3-oxoacyl-[acyl-carrier protein] reductase